MMAPSAASPSAMPPPMLGLVPVTMATRSLSFMMDLRSTKSVWRGDQERLGRIEDPGVDEARLLGRALELAHGAGEAHPVQDLLLPAVLDGGTGIATPGLPVAVAQRLGHAPVGRRVGPQEVVLGGEEGMAPARRGAQRHAVR